MSDDELRSQISPMAGKPIRSYAAVAEDLSLQMFKLGMSWAATLVGGSEFPGVPDKGADIIARFIRAEAANISQIPGPELKPEDSP